MADTEGRGAQVGGRPPHAVEEEQLALIEAWHAASLALIGRLMGKVGVHSKSGAAYGALLEAVARYEKHTHPPADKLAAERGYGIHAPLSAPTTDAPDGDRSACPAVAALQPNCPGHKPPPPMSPPPYGTRGMDGYFIGFEIADAEGAAHLNAVTRMGHRTVRGFLRENVDRVLNVAELGTQGGPGGSPGAGGRSVFASGEHWTEHVGVDQGVQGPPFISCFWLLLFVCPTHDNIREIAERCAPPFPFRNTRLLRVGVYHNNYARWAVLHTLHTLPAPQASA